MARHATAFDFRWRARAVAGGVRRSYAGRKDVQFDRQTRRRENSDFYDGQPLRFAES